MRSEAVPHTRCRRPRSCAGNLAEAYPDSAAVPVPQPVNIFMTVEHAPDGTLTLGESPTAAGDSITPAARCAIVW